MQLPNHAALEALSVDEIDELMRSLSRTAVWHFALGGLAGYFSWQSFTLHEVALGEVFPGDIVIQLFLMVTAVAFWAGAWADVRKLFRVEALVLRKVPIARVEACEPNFMRDFREGVRQEKD